MLTVRQSNALFVLNKAVEEARDCGLFDEIKFDKTILGLFSTEISIEVKKNDCSDYSDCNDNDNSTEHDDFLNRVIERLK